MSKMLCPLCGREMTAIETYAGRGELYCERCDLTIGGDSPKTPSELSDMLNKGPRMIRVGDLLQVIGTEDISICQGGQMLYSGGVEEVGAHIRTKKVKAFRQGMNVHFVIEVDE